MLQSGIKAKLISKMSKLCYIYFSGSVQPQYIFRTANPAEQMSPDSWLDNFPY